VARDVPPYLFQPGWDRLGSRGARQRQVLAGDGKLTREQLEELVFDVFVPDAYYGVRALRGATLSGRAAELDAILAEWDGKATVDSEAMTIAFYLNRALPDGLPRPQPDETSHFVEP